MTSPDKVNRPAVRKQRANESPVDHRGERQSETRHIEERVEPVDSPLYEVVPDRGMQRQVLLWVGLTMIASLTTTCVVAIATGAVPTALCAALGALATALLLIVRSVFAWRGNTRR